MKSHILALVFCALAVTLIPVMLHADEQSSSPYSLEAENGDVRQPDGRVIKAPDMLPSPVNVPDSGGVYTLPLSEQAPLPEPRGISEKQPDAPANPATDMHRVAPTPVTSEPETTRDPGESKTENKKKRFHSPSTGDKTPNQKKPATKQPESIQPARKEPVSEKPPGKEIESGGEKPTTPDPAKGRACEEAPLTQDVSFSLQSTRIEYNMCDKTLRAENAQFTQSNFTISAAQIRMDLHRGLLAASGGAAAYDSYFQHQHMTGDLIVLNLRTREGTAVAGGVTRAFSVSSIGSYFESPDSGSISQASLLEPASAAPSLQGTTDVGYTPGAPRDTIQAGSLTVSATPASLTFLKVSYTDASGQQRFVPKFQTTSGTLHEKAPALRYLYVLSSPSQDYNYASADYDYFFQDDPRGKASLTGIERHTWDGRNSHNEHDFDYTLTKNYIRGNSVLEMSAERSNDWTRRVESFSQYFFPGRFIIRARYQNVDWDSDSYNTAMNAFTVLGRWSSPGFIADIDAASSKQANRAGAMSSSTDYDLSQDNFSGTLRMKPRPVLGGTMLAGLYGSVSVSGADQNYTNGTLYQYDDTAKSLTAYLLGNPLLLTPNLELVTRADWQYRSDDYRVDYLNNEQHYIYRQHVSHGEESATARAGLRWRALKQWVLGLDYLTERSRGGGGGYWALYAAFSGADTWTLRLSANYRPELAAEGVDYPETVMGETADLSWQINAATYASASWDLDNRLLGLSLYRLGIHRDYTWGQLLFRVERTPEQRVHWESGARYSYYRTPARYYLNLLFQ